MDSPRLARVLRVLIGIVAALFVLFASVGIYLYVLSQDLPEVDVDAVSLATPRTSIVFAADGSVLAEWHGEQDRVIVPLDSIPEDMRNAVVAVEDERFYEHHGVDVEAIMRALKANTEEGGVTQGGSTITQQVVKLLFTDGERTLTRKVREALLAYEVEARTDKGEVLEVYLNLVYFGNGSYGVESAAHNFFGKSADELTLAEAALLAGVLRSPGAYSPARDPDAARARRDVVLGKMREQGYITREQEIEAKAEDIVLVPPKDASTVAPYFVEYVKQALIDELGANAVYEGGLRVYTTIDLTLQTQAEAAAAAYLAGPNDPEVALVCVEHRTGHILAMVGGRDFQVSQFNLAVQGRRQPGSAFKPFVLVAALEAGVKPSATFDASPYTVKVDDGVWSVQNYENSISGGTYTLADATTWSINAVYARLVMKVGPEAVVDTAYRMGITSELEANPAIALGGLAEGVSPLEMASAYGTIASGGMHVEPTGIVRVTNDRGDLIYEPLRQAERAVSEAVAVQASKMLHDVIESGTGQAARFGQWSAGKTGTNQEYRDAWFVGYSGSLSTAVWVGYRDAQVAMTNVHGVRVSGGSFPAMIWKAFMQRAVEYASAPAGSPETIVEQPEGGAVVVATVCKESFLLANDRCPHTIQLEFEPDMAPVEVCTAH